MNVAVILTGGNGTRMGSSLPKQFIKVQGKEIFIHTLNQFLTNPNIDRCLLVINSLFETDYKNILADNGLLNKVEFCYGGNTRQESSFNSLEYLRLSGINKNDIILIHDGARPLVSHRIIDDNISMCKNDNVAISTIVPMFDTLVDKEYNVLDRNNVFSVQTPQTFRFDTIYNLHKKAKENNLCNVSDDVQLAKYYNIKIAYVNGSRRNIKITTQEDLDLFKSFLRK